MPRVGDNTIHLEAIRPTQRLGISVGRSTSFRCKKVYPFPEMPLTYLKTCRPSTAFFPLINVTLSGGNSSPKPLTVIYE